MNIFTLTELVKRLNMVYYLIYCLTIVVTAFGFFLDFHNFIAASSADINFIAIVYIILSIVFMGFALLWFEFMRRKIKIIRNEKQKMKLYGSAAVIRLYLIGLALVGGIVIFYLTKNINTLYCIAVAAIALIYCKPGENKVSKDLQIGED